MPFQMDDILFGLRQTPGEHGGLFIDILSQVGVRPVPGILSDLLRASVELNLGIYEEVR